jgi:hypothetical protein
VAPEAAKDVVNYHPGNLLPFNLQVPDDGGLQALQTLSGGVQHRKDSVK